MKMLGSRIRSLGRIYRDPNGLQFFVGISAGIGAFAVVLLNILSLVKSGITDPFAIMGRRGVLVLSVSGMAALASALWKSRAAQWIQVLLLFVTALLSALSAHAGDLTSALALIFGLVLAVEYEFGRKSLMACAGVALIAYPLALARGYGADSRAYISQTGAAMLGLLFFIALYGAVLLRHRVRHRDEAELLESKVRERTAELEGLLSERAAMLHEMHHRVKNNLQLVASLLRLESDRIEDPRLSAPLDAGVRRIDAMALVHDALYDAERLDLVDFGDYARSVVATIARETGFCIDFSEEGKVLGRLDLAVPFGLLLHELATNAQKHAFPGGGGCAKVGLAAREDMVELRVADEGVGMGSAETGTAPGALGLDLVRALVSQLRGTIERLPGAGTLWLLRFPLDPSAKSDPVA